MTSKISFFKLCMENIKRRTWLLVITILTYFVSMPLAMMITIQNVQSRQRVSATAYEEIFGIFFGMSFHLILAAGLAILCAVSGFSWLFSKKKVDMYHSMPVKREKLFAVIYVNGILLWLAPYLVSLLVCLPIISSYVTITGAMAKMALITVGVNLLFFLLFYHLMLVAVMLTGNMINCVVTGGVLFAYAAALRALLELYLEYYIVSWYPSPEMIEEFKFTSPVMAAIYFAEKFTGWSQEIFTYLTGGAFALYLLQCFLLAVIAGVAALLLYRRRPSEAAGKSIAFEKIMNLYRIILVIPLSLASGLFFTALVNGSGDAVKTAWLIFGLIFGLILSHGFIEVLFQMDIRAMFSYKRQLLITGVVVILLAFGFKEDWYGINSYLPQEKKLASVAILDESVPNQYYWNTLTGERMDEEDYILDNMRLTDNESAYELARLGAEYAGKDIFADSFMRYVVKYRLKSGREVLRTYCVPTELASPQLESLYGQKEYRESTLGLFLEISERVNEVTITDIDGNNYYLEGKRAQEFLAVYKEEYASLAAEDILKGSVVAEFDCEQIVWEEGDSRTVERLGEVYLYAACTKTLQFLEEQGIDTGNMTDKVSGDINEIIIIAHSEEAALELSKGETVHYGYYDYQYLVAEESYEKLLPYLVKDMESYGGYKEYDDRYTVYVTVKGQTDEFVDEYDGKYEYTVAVDEDGTVYRQRWVQLKQGAPIEELELELITEE